MALFFVAVIGSRRGAAGAQLFQSARLARSESEAIGSAVQAFKEACPDYSVDEASALEVSASVIRKAYLATRLGQ